MTRNRMLGLTLVAIISILSNSCGRLQGEDIEQEKEPDRPQARFEPKDGEVLVFVGQELEAIGGLEEFNNGYLDHFRIPAGWTAYTSLMPGDSVTFNAGLKGLDGVWTTDTWGDGYSNMSLQAADDDFKHMTLAIGLAMVNNERRVASGELDTLVRKFGTFLKELAPRPVFLRIGYEFDGHAWNHYDREDYLSAYRRIVDILKAMKCENVAFVWQSTGWVSNHEMLEAWYPGDDYVDWCGFSFFSRYEEQKMISFARAKRKPVFIAEASPTISDYMVKFNGDTKETILSNTTQAQEAWEKWFIPLFKTIEENHDVVKAFSYINCNWRANEMWTTNLTFKDIDARLQTGVWISEKWKEEMAKSRYVHASSDLFENLGSDGKGNF